MKNNITIKGFIKFCNGAFSRLITPLRHQLGVDSDSEFFDVLIHVGDCDPHDGFAGFDNYIETSMFWRNYRKKIVDYLDEAADEFEYNAMNLVSQITNGKYSDYEIGKALYSNYDDCWKYIYDEIACFILGEAAYKFGQYLYEVEHD